MRGTVAKRLRKIAQYTSTEYAREPGSEKIMYIENNKPVIIPARPGWPSLVPESSKDSVEIIFKGQQLLKPDSSRHLYKRLKRLQ